MTKLNEKCWCEKGELKAVLPLWKDMDEVPNRVEVRYLRIDNNEEWEILNDALQGYIEALMEKIGYTEEQILVKIHGRAWWNMIRDMEKRGIKVTTGHKIKVPKE